MIEEIKLAEWRPEECGTRIGDVVRTEAGLLLLKVKCRRCSKTDGVDVFHYTELTESGVADIRLLGQQTPSNR
jgi:hypothetical protein